MEKADQVRLNHELLIWVGFTLTNGVWSYPDGVTVDNGVPYFPESLDEIFKWLMPKLKVVVIKLVPTQRGRYGCALTPDGWGVSVSMIADAPALALCLAIQKLIRSK